MMNIREQLLAVGNDLARNSGLILDASVEDSHTLSLKTDNKAMTFYIASTHILEGKREYVLICDELENHHYTRLEIALIVKADASEVEYLNYPPYRSIVKHFEK